jgi:hypothetical protein
MVCKSGGLFPQKPPPMFVGNFDNFSEAIKNIENG